MRIGSITALGLLGLLAGCVNNGDDYYYDAGFPPAPGNDSCARGCNTLNACGFCEVDGNGYCISPSDCASQCRIYDRGPIYGCIERSAGCDQLRIEACYAGDYEPPVDDPPATGDDGCAEGCNALRACGLCVTDDRGCLPAQQCAEQCRDEDQQRGYQCIADQRACGEDVIEECFDDDQPIPIDECAAGCAALDDCQLCWPDDAGACLSVDACAALCRREETPIACYGELESCDADAIASCGEAPPVDCADLCALFEGEARCAGCLTADRRCVETAVCVAACEDDPALAACLAEVDSCADPAVLDCPGVAVPERVDMGAGEDLGVPDGGLDMAVDMGVADMAPVVDVAVEDMGVEDLAPVVDAAPDAAADMAPAADCAAACEGIAACEPCLPGGGAEGCLSGISCALRCARSPDQAACVAALEACDPEAVAARCP